MEAGKKRRDLKELVANLLLQNNQLKKAELKKGQRPVLLSDNSAYYVSSELKDYLKTENILPINGRVMHPQTQVKRKVSPNDEKCS